MPELPNSYRHLWNSDPRCLSQKPVFENVPSCTVFVFLSLMEYALVNIVMGDIADIEKKKSMGISSLILGTRGVPIARKDGAIDHEVRNYFRPRAVMYISRVRLRSILYWKLIFKKKDFAGRMKPAGCMLPFPGRRNTVLLYGSLMFWKIRY